MEYLTNYGWAVLIVIVVGAVLMYYGALKPPIAKTTSGFGSLAIIDQEWTAGTIGTPGSDSLRIQVENRAGDGVIITDMTIDGISIGGANGNLPLTLRTAGKAWIVGSVSPGTAGEIYTPTIVIMYTKGGQSLSTKGTISGQRS